MPRLHPTLLATALAAAALAPAAHAETRTTIAQFPNGTDVKTLGDLALVNVQAPDTKLYSLQLLKDGKLTPVNVTPSVRPIDADLGTDSKGNPAIVFSRCSDPTKPTDPTAGSAAKTVGNCDLSILRPGTDVTPQPISNANSAAAEYAPTLWRGRLAFARSYSAKGSPVIYTKRMTARRSTPSTRLPGVPGKRCSVQYKPGDCTTTSRRVDGLELYGTHLAQTVGYVVEDQAGFDTQEIRNVDIDRRTSELVALSVAGEGGQTLVGASFTPGYLTWYRSCLGDPGGCRGVGGGAFRYRYTPRTYEHSTETIRVLQGYAPTTTGTLQDVQTSGDSDATTLDATGPLTWEAIDGDRVK